MNSNKCAYVDKGLRLYFEKKEGVTRVCVRPCCKLIPNLINSDAKRYIPLVDTSTITNHPLLNFFKDYFNANDTLHPSCVSCINEEKSGVKSARQKLNDISTENPDYDFLKLDVVIGNKCNLACPFCSRDASSLIQSLADKYSKDELPQHWLSPARGQADPEVIGQACADLLKKYKIYSFKIIGGEPFLKENWEPIGKVLDENYCRDLELEVTTNGTIMNSKVIERISKTKNTKLRISVDSIGKNYDFIRWPHRWDKMKDNLLFLRDNKPDNCDVNITVLANIFNFEFLPDIERFFTEENIRFGVDFTLKPLGSPLQWNNLSDNIIDYVYNNVNDIGIKKGIKYGRTLDKNIDLGTIIKDTNFYLTQRNMKAESVLGPMTKKFLCL